MALSFVSNVNGMVGTPVPVTVYDGSGVAIDPSLVTWSALPAGVTVAPNGAGFLFSSTGVVSASVTAHSGISAGTLLLSFAAPPLKFTSP